MSNPLYPTPQTNTAAINTDVVITLTALPGSARRSIEKVIWSHDGDPASATRLTIESPASTVLFDIDITKGGPGFIDFGKPGIRGAEGQALVARLNLAADANTIGTLNVIEGNA